MANFLDGSLKAGSFDLSITPPVSGSAVVYTARSFKVTQGTNKERQTDKDGLPKASNYVPEFVTGTATLQYASATTNEPALFSSFAVDGEEAGTTQTYIITEVSPSRNQGAIATVDIGFDLKLN